MCALDLRLVTTLPFGPLFTFVENTAIYCPNTRCVDLLVVEQHTNQWMRTYSVDVTSFHLCESMTVLFPLVYSSDTHELSIHASTRRTFALIELGVRPKHWCIVTVLFCHF